MKSDDITLFYVGITSLTCYRCMHFYKCVTTSDSRACFKYRLVGNAPIILFNVKRSKFLRKGIVCISEKEL